MHLSCYIQNVVYIQLNLTKLFEIKSIKICKTTFSIDCKRKLP